MQVIKTHPMRCWPVKTILFIYIYIKKSDRPTLNKMVRPLWHLPELPDDQSAPGGGA